MVYSYKKADLEGLRETLNHIPWEFVISSSDLNDSVTKFQDLLLSAIAEHVPLITLRGRSRPPWITSEVMKLVRKKKALWKRLRRNNCPELFSRFKQLRKQTKKCIAASYHHYLQSLSEKLKVDPKKFWSYHAIKSNTRRLPAVVTYKDRSASDPADKAALFNTFFSTVYASNAISSGDLNDDVVHPNLCMKISTTQEEVEDILLRLNVHKRNPCAYFENICKGVVMAFNLSV